MCSWPTQHPCVCVLVVCCPAGQVQVWDTQDEESMDPLLNIADEGFDAEVRGGSGALGFRVLKPLVCLCAGVKQQMLTPAQLICKQAARLVCWGGARQELASQERGSEPCCPCGMRCCVQIMELAWDANSRLLAAAAGSDVLVW